MTDPSVDPSEVAKFEAMAADWWDPNGSTAPLHAMNPCRLDYIVAQICGEFDRDIRVGRPFEGLSVLDVGCGGGLLSEPLARLGARVTGVDAAAKNVEIARAHARDAGMEIDYRAVTAESLLAEGAAFDVVLGMEIVEHVADPATFLRSLGALARPGGLVVVSTLNRTARSFAAAIVGAEWVMRWLPRGTHDWSKFVSPEDLAGMMREAGLDPVDRKGMVPDPLRGQWRLSDRDLSVNYVMTGVRT
ncbi:3-demethylubiquinone-9 3-methyltransferase [Roseivivax halodurans JCM 10272]|uniref:Ubiquinone biosynthesis O-methyltransferase n=1 Tax=Roseivivax halodurans JCM 10272 TaxID=1449350 RepID=X7EIR9_9RHOB|nr:bifunctional 2-polyprenyl-6-hydroxyphenol methylase/3-demethylubiquinol 3-O-methyltransferase UbiG [Roseivivax halodurans]ETX15043.1 3-demethylubiquinone-9 3-methyltransferase [Roseivivax halodurans JCM 10272]